MGLFRVLTIALFILAIPVALITTNIRVAVSDQRVYDYSVRTYDAAVVSGIPEDELLRANGEIERYLTSGGSGSLAIRVKDHSGDSVSLFNAREIAHMADVRDLIQALFFVQIMAVATVVGLAVIMLVLWPPRALAAAALYGSVLTGAVLGLAAALALSGFDSAWSQFHVFAFSNDLWQLDPASDHLIQMFPEAFWQEITTLIGAVALLEALFIAGPATAYLIRSRPRESSHVTLPRPEVAGPGGHAHPALDTPKSRRFVP